MIGFRGIRSNERGLDVGVVLGGGAVVTTLETHLLLSHNRRLLIICCFMNVYRRAASCFIWYQ